MGVAFLNRNSRMGSKAVVGPITGLSYIITAWGTPVSDYDVASLLSMTEPPCCGQALPLDGQVKSFGTHAPTDRQLAEVPDEIMAWRPSVVENRSKRVKPARLPRKEKDQAPILVTVIEEESDGNVL